MIRFTHYYMHFITFLKVKFPEYLAYFSCMPTRSKQYTNIDSQIFILGCSPIDHSQQNQWNCQQNPNSLQYAHLPIYLLQYRLKQKNCYQVDNIREYQLMDNNKQSVIKQIDSMLKSKQCKQLANDIKYIQSLPKQFIHFMKDKQIDIEQLTVPIPRYIRVKPSQAAIDKAQICQSLSMPQNQIVKVDDQFYALHPQTKIHSSSLYQQGRIYGMDYSSCIPARCLNVGQNHQVLQLCSAPGNKSMYIADLVPTSRITGVQVNHNRANIMKSLINKYNLQQRIKVQVQDGLKYDHEDKFDRVLIDAQCTHEGSIKHIKKFMSKQQENEQKLNKNEIKQKKKMTKQQQKQFEMNNSNPYTSQIKKANKWSEQDFKQRFLDQKKLNNLWTLQKGLLQNGFRLLKEDGILVYSTCSFDQSQNEDIIQQFLKQNKNAYLIDCKQDLKCSVDYELGRLKQTIRFCPSVSRCGGMFVCKIGKIKQKQKED